MAGSLPPAVLNIAAIQISMTGGVVAALLFSAGVVLVEIVFVRLALVAIDWFRRRAAWFQAIEWLSVVIVLVLAAGSFHAALSGRAGGGKEALLPDLPPFLIGLLLRAINPTLIPFWFGWGVVLLEQGVLRARRPYYTVFAISAGLGTLLAHSLYILGGTMAADWFRSWESEFYWVIGGIFVVTAGIQVWRILHKKGVGARLRSTRRKGGD